MSGSINTCEACGEAYWTRGPASGHVCTPPDSEPAEADQADYAAQQAVRLLKSLGFRVTDGLGREVTE